MELTCSQRSLAASSFLFQDVPEEGLDFALSQCREERSARGQELYTPRHFHRCLALVLSGRVQVTRGELLVDTLGRGDWFGAAALFNAGEEFPSTLTALSECRVLFFPQETVAALMERWPAAGANYVRYLSGRIRFLSDRLNSLTAGSAEDMVARYLQSAAASDGTVTVAAASVARILGLGRASVYRAFDALEARGILSRDGKEIRMIKEELL